MPRHLHTFPVLFADLDFIAPSLDSPFSAPENMAVDEAVARTAEVPTLRVYRWATPAITFGYFEPWNEVLAGLSEVEHSLEKVRRWTGGGVVRHGHDLTYALAVPRSHPFSRLPAVETYGLLHQGLQAVFEKQGQHTGLTPTTGAKTSRACFENPVQFDLLLGDRKVAGAAQRRSRHGLLHQGSIQGTEIGPGFALHLASALGGNINLRELSMQEQAAARELSVTKYSTREWNERS